MIWLKEEEILEEVYEDSEEYEDDEVFDDEEEYEREWCD